jgi:hypothetical protein
MFFYEFILSNLLYLTSKSKRYVLLLNVDAKVVKIPKYSVTLQIAMSAGDIG